MSDPVRKLIEGSEQGAARQWDSEFLSSQPPMFMVAGGIRLNLNLDGTISGDAEAFLKAAYSQPLTTPSINIIVAFGRMAVRLAAFEKLLKP